MFLAFLACNLSLASEQGSDRYDSKQQQGASAGNSFTFGSMTGPVSVNLSRDMIHSTWQRVEQQTGLFMGKDGFDARGRTRVAERCGQRLDGDGAGHDGVNLAQTVSGTAPAGGHPQHDHHAGLTIQVIIVSCLILSRMSSSQATRLST